MAKFLSLSGVGSYLQLPTLTIKKIVIDGYFPTQTGDLKILIDSRDGQNLGYVYARLDGSTTSAGANYNVTNYARNVRSVVEFNAVNNIDGNGNFTDNTTIFANKTFGENFIGLIYNVKCYNNAGTLVAHYDMNTGTIQDQTGNGNHATMSGGTFIDDTKTYYLSMDGIDDVLQLPSFTASSVVIDCYINSSQNNSRDVLFDARSGSTYFIDIGFTNLRFKINGGAEKLSNTDIPRDSRNALDIRQSFSSVVTWSDNTTVFASNTGTNPLAGKIYNVKLYNDTTLQAEYDFTKGHALDISGNFRHASLTGGTWVEDAAPPTGIDGSNTLSLTNQLYKDNNNALNFINALFKDNQNLLNFNNVIYKDSQTLLNLIQSIYADGTTTLSLIQNIFDASSTFVTLDLKQVIYQDSNITLNTLQTIYKDTQSGLNMIQQMFKNNSIDLNLILDIRNDVYVYKQLLETIFKINKQLETTMNLQPEVNTTFKINKEIEIVFKI